MSDGSANQDTSTWQRYENYLAFALGLVDRQIDSINRIVGRQQSDIDFVNQYKDHLAGKYGDTEDPRAQNATTLVQDVQELVAANNNATGQRLVVADFLAGPQEVNLFVDDNLFQGNFDFRGFAEKAAEIGALRTPGSLRQAIETVEDFYEVSNLDTRDVRVVLYTQRPRTNELDAGIEAVDPGEDVLEAHSGIYAPEDLLAQLTEIKNLLSSDDPELQVQGFVQFDDRYNYLTIDDLVKDQPSVTADERNRAAIESGVGSESTSKVFSQWDAISALQRSPEDEIVDDRVPSFGTETGTRFRERGVAAALEPEPTLIEPESTLVEPEPATRRAFGLPPSERLDTMGARPDFLPGMSDEEVRAVLRGQRAYDAEVERRERLEQGVAGRQMRADAIAATSDVLDRRLEEIRIAQEIEERRAEFVYNWSGQAAAAEARAEAIARVSGPDALERARLTARNMRVRGRGDAKASFEEGMAALQRRPAGTRGVASRPASERGGLGPAPSEDFSGIPSLTVDTSTAASELFAGRPPGDQALQDLIDTTAETPVVTPQLTAAQIREANQAEVELLLAEQFGGFSFFLQKHRSDLQVGLTADGQVVAADDPNAASVKNILDVIVDQGITAPTRVLGLLENTEWWQKTDAKMREYDVLTADMSEPQKLEYLEPVLDTLRDEAQFLGFQLDPTRARDLAEQITRMGEEGDAEYIRGLLTAEGSFNAAEVTASSFAAARDEIVAMSKRYFTPINEADAAAFAQDIYVGTKTAEGVEQYFREMAANTFPQLQNALNAGITPEQYFAPYKYEIERMLDRPNVDLYEEFGDVVQFIPDTGTGESRPMTLGEVRKYVRGLDEWQQSSQGTDSARALAFSIGKVFGEVA